MRPNVKSVGLMWENSIDLSKDDFIVHYTGKQAEDNFSLEMLGDIAANWNANYGGDVFQKPTLENLYFDGSKVYADLGQMGYDTLVYLNAHPSKKAYQNSISIGSVLVTSDNKTAAFRRAKWVAEYPEAWHVIGSYARVDKKMHPFDSLAGKTQMQDSSELGIEEDYSDRMRLTNIVKDLASNRLEFATYTKMNVSSSELEDMFYNNLKKAEKSEHDEILVTDINRMISFLMMSYAVPVGYGDFVAYKNLTDRS